MRSPPRKRSEGALVDQNLLLFDELLHPCPARLRKVGHQKLIQPLTRIFRCSHDRNWKLLGQSQARDE